MRFNPYPNKQPTEVNFARKFNAEVYLPVQLENSPVKMCKSQKHLRLFLDKHLNFHEHTEKKIKLLNN